MATIVIVKRVLENKLEQVAEDKLIKIKEKVNTQQMSEEDRAGYISQIQVRDSIRDRYFFVNILTLVASATSQTDAARDLYECKYPYSNAKNRE
jgi:hypothetical protein